MKGGVILIKRRSAKKFEVYKAAITLTFNAIADLNKWPREEATVATSEYFNLIQTLKTKKEKIGGASGSETFHKFAGWISGIIQPNFNNPVIRLLVGNIDTPCTTVLTIISIGVWAAFIYNVVNKVSPAEAERSLAQPVQYLIYNISPELYEMENTIHNTILNYVSTISIPTTMISAAQIVSTARTLFYESTLYKRAFERPIVCALKTIFESCVVECNNRRLNLVKHYVSVKNALTKQKKTRSRSRSRSKSKSKSKSKSRSKSKYHTPKSTRKSSTYYTPKEK
jgi:hypothetical protein